MFRCLLSLFLVAAMSVTALAQERVISASGVGYVKERIVQLPQDADKPYLMVIGNPNDDQVQKVVQWFETNADLVALKNQTHYNFVPTVGSAKITVMYRERFGPFCPNAPCVVLTKADGTKVSELIGNQIPMSAEALVNALNREAKECFRRRGCPDGNCPQPSPAPDPQPQPLPPPTPSPKPPAYVPWVVLGILTSIGAILGVRREWKTLYLGRK